MKKKATKDLCFSIGMLAAFLLWTAAVHVVDVQAIGPQGSSVGFATINRSFHDLTGVHMSLYNITDRWSLVPLGLVIWSASLGLIQCVKRKHLLKVDRSLLVLGGFYVIVMAVYVFFEVFVVNYRPVLINGYLEASYPSSTTMLVLCVMPTETMQLHARIKSKGLKRYLSPVMTAFTVFMVVGRLLSGVHWFTDIVGGALLSGGLVLMYRFVIGLTHPADPNTHPKDK